MTETIVLSTVICMFLAGFIWQLGSIARRVGPPAKLQVDQDGYAVMYKWLVRTSRGYRSPERGTLWIDGRMSATEPPATGNEHGVHGSLTPSWPGLEVYRRMAGRGRAVLVRLRCSGAYVLGAQEGKFEHVEIMEVLKCA